MIPVRNDPVRLTYVGCGKAKREVNGHPNHAENQYAVANLYTSNYFALKREYAERMSYHWSVLSAKHGILTPFSWATPYDVTISDYPLEDDDTPFQTVDEWAEDVVDGIADILPYFSGHDAHPPIEEIVMLAGKDYLDPLRDGLAEISRDFGVEVRYPFDGTSGIGDQMAWLKEHTDTDAPVSDPYASIIYDEDE